MPIRVRLTLWYTAILFATLATFAVVMDVGLERLWQSRFDTTVQGQAQEAKGQLTVLIGRSSGFIAGPDQGQIDALARDGVSIQYVDANGADQGHSSNLRAPLTFSPDAIQAIHDGTGGYRALRDSGGTADRAYFLPLRVGTNAPYGAVIAAKSTASLVALRHRVQTLLLGGTVGVTLLLALIVYLVARAALRPIDRMASNATSIQAAQDLSRRVEVPQTQDEVATLGRTFNAMLGRLQASFEAQRRFIADASHELRTPLTAIRGNLDLLHFHGARMEEGEREEIIDELRSETERMTRLVTDLLGLARVQAGEPQQLRPLRLDETLEGTVRTARGLSNGRDIIAVPSAEPIWVMGDADRLKQLALILLDNAIKYTPSASHIGVWVQQRDGRAEFRVVDDGPGIPADCLPLLFDRFYRGGTPARGRDDGGAGLGLAIARDIVDGHKGTIAVESTVGEGTAFIVALPLLVPTPAMHLHIQ